MEKQIDERLRKNERLKTREEIQNVLTQRGVKGSLCILHIQPTQGEVSRLGIIVTRSLGGAVKRNRIKRIFREVFRHKKSHLKKTVDIVVRARRASRDASYIAIAKDIDTLLRKQNLL